MTKIVVDMNELNKYSGQLLDDAREFGNITNNMQSIIEELRRRGWSGYDADTFVKNSTSYLRDLRVVRAALVESSRIVQGRNKKYSQKVEEYFDKVKYRGDENERQYIS